MEKYKVEIKETLCRIVETEAASQEAALQQIKRQYKDSQIVLTANDYVDTDVNICK